MKHMLWKISSVLLILYAVVVLLLYIFQRRLIFFPERLPQAYAYQFDGRYEELWFTVDKNVRLNGLLFHASAPKGLIFYLHGNAGSLRTWGAIAPLYTALGYDLMILDYRG